MKLYRASATTTNLTSMACFNPNIVAETISQGNAPTEGNTQRDGKNNGTVEQNVGGNAQVGRANRQFGGKSKRTYCKQCF